MERRMKNESGDGTRKNELKVERRINIKVGKEREYIYKRWKWEWKMKVGKERERMNKKMKGGKIWKWERKGNISIKGGKENEKWKRGRNEKEWIKSWKEDKYESGKGKGLYK